MAKGIIYCMTTIVDGLVKIGKTKKENFKQRMYHLEHNGYAQIVGLKRRFAIEVEDIEKRFTFLHNFKYMLKYMWRLKEMKDLFDISAI